MAVASGNAAFRQVEAALRGQPADSNVAEYPFRQLIRGAQTSASPLDNALLLRTALRYWSERVGTAESVAVSPAISLPSSEVLKSAGLHVRTSLGTRTITASPWAPQWLETVPGFSVDGAAAGEQVRRTFDEVPGDPFLRRIKFAETAALTPRYRSEAQRSAIRAALDAPPGSVLAVCLGTGEGKSLAFQLVAEVGYGEPSGRQGVTFVITPTVALAVDHERAALALGMVDKPRAYIGGGASEANERIKREIEEGTQGLCFASPEAACGSLQPSLQRAAELGHLRCLVIDEAHLVNTWGDEFRPSFQLLGGLRRGLLRRCEARPFRTLLLSATLSPSTIEVLRALFAQNLDGTVDPLRVAGAVNLRPEIDYWASPLCAVIEQEQWTVEALLHVPRPAILYVTRKVDAYAWLDRARQLGFRRVTAFTGRTASNERRAIIKSWQAGDLDLIVATSAFGLGIDHPHVRSVIHACIPETLDRFYQEVGRGGRDGRASMSVMIPSYGDIDMARGMNGGKLIGVELGLERWEAMFRHKDREQLAPNLWRIRVDVAAGRRAGRLDMVSPRSITWNVNTLTLMAAAGLISLEDAATFSPTDDEDSRADSDWKRFQEVRVLEPNHLSHDVWNSRVEPHRKRARKAARGSLDLLERFVRGKACMGDLLPVQYTVEPAQIGQGVGVEVQPACSGCPACRGKARRDGLSGLPMPWPWTPWRARPLEDLLDSSGRLLVIYDGDLLPAGARQRRRTIEGLAVALRAGIRNIIAPTLDLSVIQDQVPDWAMFQEVTLLVPDLPPGPTMYLLERTNSVTRTLFAAPPPGVQEYPMIVVLPDDTPDPARPAARLLERYSGRRMTLAEFVDAVRT